VSARGEVTTPADLLHDVLERQSGTPDPRLLEIMTALVRHLHTFATEVQLTEAEWAAGISCLTEIGQLCDDRRQEFILASDTLGLSMLVDLIAHDASSGATESTVLGPFYLPGSPDRPNGANTAERPSGVPAFVQGPRAHVSGCTDHRRPRRRLAERREHALHRAGSGRTAGQLAWGVHDRVRRRVQLHRRSTARLSGAG
jgi:hypothetical protein